MVIMKRLIEAQISEVRELFAHASGQMFEGEDIDLISWGWGMIFFISECEGFSEAPSIRMSVHLLYSILYIKRLRSYLYSIESLLHRF